MTAYVRLVRVSPAVAVALCGRVAEVLSASWAELDDQQLRILAVLALHLSYSQHTGPEQQAPALKPLVSGLLESIPLQSWPGVALFLRFAVHYLRSACLHFEGPSGPCSSFGVTLTSRSSELMLLHEYPSAGSDKTPEGEKRPVRTGVVPTSFLQASLWPFSLLSEAGAALRMGAHTAVIRCDTRRADLAAAVDAGG